MCKKKTTCCLQPCGCYWNLQPRKLEWQPMRYLLELLVTARYWYIAKRSLSKFDSRFNDVSAGPLVSEIWRLAAHPLATLLRVWGQAPEAERFWDCLSRGKWITGGDWFLWNRFVEMYYDDMMISWNIPQLKLSMLVIQYLSANIKSTRWNYSKECFT